MRRNYIDNLRSLTVFSVVIYHAIMIYSATEDALCVEHFSDFQFQDAILYLLYPWFMAILFVISGMSSRYYLQNHSAKEFQRSRSLKLLVPSTIGIIVFHWIQGLINLKCANGQPLPPEIPFIVKIAIIIASGTSILWFAQVLWLFSMLLILFNKAEKNKIFNFSEKLSVWGLILMGFLFWGSSQILNMPIIATYRFGIYGFCFFSGYFVFANDKVPETLANNWIWLGLIALVLGIAYTSLYFGKNYAVVPYVNCTLACAYGWFAILFLFGFSKRFLDCSSNAWSFLKNKSWGIYIFHYLGISSAALFLRRTSLPPVFKYAIVFTSGIAASAFFYETISRIPFLRWCILGINKKNKAI